MTTNCPKCQSIYAYQDAGLWICPECAHEWNDNVATIEAATVTDDTVRDSNGNVLVDGDSVTVIKDLKVKGSSSGIKSGTKIRNIRLLKDPEDGHNFSCKVDGIGAINLKSEFVRKV